MTAVRFRTSRSLPRARRVRTAFVAWLVAGGGLLAGSALRAEPLVSQPGSTMSLAGKASLWDWSCESRTVQAMADPGVPFHAVKALLSGMRPDAGGTLSAESALLPQSPPRGRVRIAVEDVDCGNRTMERDLQRALGADRFPEVTYTFERLQGTSVRNEGGRPVLVLHTLGAIAMAGEQRIREVDVRVGLGENGTLRVDSEFRIFMSEFGVEPPTAMLGMLRARDEVQIAFRLLLGPDLSEVPAADFAGPALRRGAR